MENGILTNREMRRYSRQIMLPEMGVSGQEKLKKANVLVIGAGGLGCPVLQYLAAAGTGRISIIDFDMVDETNLARQVLYGAADLGKLKSIIAKSRLEYLNPLCEYTVINRRIDESGPNEFFRNYDVIVDATDNPETRYVINDTSVVYGKPMVHGSIYKFDGLVSVFNYNNGPTYRDFNPEQFRKDYLNPSPVSTGFFGVLPGITGLYMANEVLKIITGIGDVLSGTVLLVNLFGNRQVTFTLKKEEEAQKMPEMAGSMAL
jgi:sulfur-carrier protein adenylyltransferase/sulfurtransferase